MPSKPKKALDQDELELDLFDDEGPAPVITPKHAQQRIDKKKFKKMLEMLATKEEVAGMFEVGEATIDRFCKAEFNETFEAVRSRYASRGKYSLRRAMYVKAVHEGNVTMQMHLSRHYLGMKDTVELEGSEEKPLTLTYKPTEVKPREVKELKDESIIEVTSKRDSEERRQEIPSEDRGDQRDPQDPSAAANGSNEG